MSEAPYFVVVDPLDVVDRRTDDQRIDAILAPRGLSREAVDKTIKEDEKKNTEEIRKTMMGPFIEETKESLADVTDKFAKLALALAAARSGNDLTTLPPGEYEDEGFFHQPNDERNGFSIKYSVDFVKGGHVVTPLEYGQDFQHSWVYGPRRRPDFQVTFKNNGTIDSVSNRPYFQKDTPTPTAQFLARHIPKEANGSLFSLSWSGLTHDPQLFIARPTYPATTPPVYKNIESYTFDPFVPQFKEAKKRKTLETSLFRAMLRDNLSKVPWSEKISVIRKK